MCSLLVDVIFLFLCVLVLIILSTQLMGCLRVLYTSSELLNSSLNHPVSRPHILGMSLVHQCTNLYNARITLTCLLPLVVVSIPHATGPLPDIQTFDTGLPGNLFIMLELMASTLRDAILSSIESVINKL